jgi:hypothetical protein
MEVHTSNPRNSGGRGKSLRPTRVELVRPFLKNKTLKNKRAGWGCGSKELTSICEALGSVPSTAKKKSHLIGPTHFARVTRQPVD